MFDGDTARSRGIDLEIMSTAIGTLTLERHARLPDSASAMRASREST